MRSCGLTNILVLVVRTDAGLWTMIAHRDLLDGVLDTLGRRADKSGQCHQSGREVGPHGIVHVTDRIAIDVAEAAAISVAGRVGVHLETQIKRTMARDNNSEEQVRAIIAAQMDREERRSRADKLIDNSGNEVEVGVSGSGDVHFHTT